ncbi:urea ABC transporter permease subunit UrtC, partial [Burkholderia pseudomallei]
MASTIHSLAVARGASPASSTASAASASPAAPRFALGLPPRPALLSRR